MSGPKVYTDFFGEVLSIGDIVFVGVNSQYKGNLRYGRITKIKEDTNNFTIRHLNIDKTDVTGGYQNPYTIFNHTNDSIVKVGRI